MGAHTSGLVYLGEGERGLQLRGASSGPLGQAFLVSWVCEALGGHVPLVLKTPCPMGRGIVGGGPLPAPITWGSRTGTSFAQSEGGTAEVCQSATLI